MWQYLAHPPARHHVAAGEQPHWLTGHRSPRGGNDPRGPSGARAPIRLAGVLSCHQQQVIGLPGGLGRPSSLGLSCGEILKAVCQDA